MSDVSDRNYGIIVIVFLMNLHPPSKSNTNVGYTHSWLYFDMFVFYDWPGSDLQNILRIIIRLSEVYRKIDLRW